MRDLDPLLHDLVAIDSINPRLVAGANGEAHMGAFIQAWCQARGIETHIQEVEPNRPNVIAIVRGTGRGKSLMLNAHMDTVGVAGMENPHQPYIKDERLYGRGAYDMKGSLAACMVALARIQQHPLPGDVMLTAVCDEEYASVGTQALLKDWHADFCVITEPTEMQLCIAHKGFVWLEVETHGIASHGSRPDLGVDAIAKMGYVLTGIEALGQILAQQTHHPLLGNGSLHASLITGGQELSSYPERCVVQIERRTLPHETPETVMAQIQDVLRQAEQQTPSFRAEARLGLVRDAFEIAPDHTLVTAMRDAVSAVVGIQPALIGQTFWMDSALTSRAGIPTVIFGPSGAGAHATTEWVDLETVAQCADIYMRLAQQVCG